MNNKSLDTPETIVAENGNVEASATNDKCGAISADISLPNDLLEGLYQRYSIKQRRAGLECFLATSVLFDLWAIFAPHQEKSLESLGKFTIRFTIYILHFDLISILPVDFKRGPSTKFEVHNSKYRPAWQTIMASDFDGLPKFWHPYFLWLVLRRIPSALIQ